MMNLKFHELFSSLYLISSEYIVVKLNKARSWFSDVLTIDDFEDTEKVQNEISSNENNWCCSNDWIWNCWNWTFWNCWNLICWCCFSFCCRCRFNNCFDWFSCWCFDCFDCWNCWCFDCLCFNCCEEIFQFWCRDKNMMLIFRCSFQFRFRWDVRELFSISAFFFISIHKTNSYKSSKTSFLFL